ncbi:hypothetical protein HK101_011239 [Irineochytrium annulatum]|nr:hypothetical protein HK101_011239 [Irineochytrium annulatum]
MPPKKKGIKMDLGSFLTDESLGSVDWADDVDLPTAPASASEYSSQQRDSRGYSTSSYGGREPSGPVTFPTRPPYTAFIGNLSFEITDRDIETFFRELRIKTIRLVRDHDTDQPKGYGYCEFDDVDSLRAAVAMNGESVQGRNIRIDVSEPKVRPGYDGDREGRPPRSDFEVPDVWRRVEPVRRASPSGSDRSFGRGGFGGDRASPIATGGVMVTEALGAGLVATEAASPIGTGGEVVATGLVAMAVIGARSVETEGLLEATEALLEEVGSDGGQRKRLELKPRTDSVRSPTSPTPETQSPAVETPTGALPSPSISEKSERSSAPKSNPFGAAKPRDEGEFQRRFEERQKAKEAELKKKEEEAKAKLAAELEEKRRLAEEAATKKAEEEVERRRKEEERKKEEADRAERAREAKEAQDTKAKEVKAAAAAPAREANGPTGGDGRGGRGGSNAGRGRGAYTRTGSFGGNAPAVPEGGGGSWRRADAAPSVPAEGGGGRGVDHHPRGGDHSRGTAERRGSWGPRGGRGGGRGDYQNSAPRAAPAPAPAAPHVTKILEKPAAEPKKNLFDLLSEEGADE